MLSHCRNKRKVEAANFETFAKLAEKADRQPVCIELNLKTILTFYKCRIIVLVQ